MRTPDLTLPSIAPDDNSGNALYYRKKTVEAMVKEAFNAGFCSCATYNDISVVDIDEEWERQKEGLLQWQ